MLTSIFNCFLEFKDNFQIHDVFNAYKLLDKLRVLKYYIKEKYISNELNNRLSKSASFLKLGGRKVWEEQNKAKPQRYEVPSFLQLK